MSDTKELQERLRSAVGDFLVLRLEAADALAARDAEIAAVWERAAKIAEQTETWTQTLEETDARDIYTGNYYTVERITPKWKDGKAIAAAVRAAVQEGER